MPRPNWSYVDPFSVEPSSFTGESDADDTSHYTGKLFLDPSYGSQPQAPNDDEHHGVYLIAADGGDVQEQDVEQSTVKPWLSADWGRRDREVVQTRPGNAGVPSSASSLRNEPIILQNQNRTDSCGGDIGCDAAPTEGELDHRSSSSAVSTPSSASSWSSESSGTTATPSSTTHVPSTTHKVHKDFTGSPSPPTSPHRMVFRPGPFYRVPTNTPTSAASSAANAGPSLPIVQRVGASPTPAEQTVKSDDEGMGVDNAEK